MTMNNIMNKLRNNNKSYYLQLAFCISFAVSMITSFLAITQMPVVQSVFPEGGDSRKQLYLIFIISLIGCTIFCIYAGMLFLRYKNKEIGVMLALGALKKDIAKRLKKEFIMIILKCIFIGIIAGEIITYLIWTVFSQYIVNKDFTVFAISPIGIIGGFIFGVFIMTIIITMSYMNIRKSNIIDIINSQRRKEEIKKVSIKKLIIGISMSVIGLLLQFGAPKFFVYVLGRIAPVYTNVFIIFTAIGVSMIIEFMVVYRKKGRNPKKYYKNLVSYGMTRFEGKQNVRNIFVVAFLLGIGIFSCSYISNIYSTLIYSKSNIPYDFILNYPKDKDEVDRNDIYKTADKYDIRIKDYNEIELIQLTASGYYRDYDDEQNGKAIEKYEKLFAISDFISESEYNRVTGKNIDISTGKYLKVITPDESENFFERFDDMDNVTNIYTNESVPLVYGGTEENYFISRNDTNRYILDDSDYSKLYSNSTENMKIKQIIFNIDKSDKSYEFSSDLYRKFLDKADREMAVSTMYNDIDAEKSGNRDKYMKENYIELSPDNPDLIDYWKWQPEFKIYTEKNFVQSVAVFFLVFSFIAVICLVSSGIILYSRSISIASRNKYVFDDLRKIGANRKYINQCLKQQILKLFTVSSILGIIIGVGINIIMFIFNDNKISGAEIMAIKINTVISIIVFIYMMLVYKFSFSKAKRIIEI